MKSFCIKTNNSNIIRYLIEEFSNLKLDNLIVSSKSFKIYENVILHYLDENTDYFFGIISSVLSNTIIKFFEPIALENELNKNFFYFSEVEKEHILELCYNENINSTILTLEKFNSLYSSFMDYISEHHSIVLTGFYNFRLKKYHQFIDEILDINVNNYLIEREYLEFINILKLYIKSNNSIISLIHIVYLNNKIILVDKNKNTINLNDKNQLNAKFLSDISFSDNDYILNYLLNILPQKIIIHIPSPSVSDDEFLNTLQLIFEDRISICRNCNICSLYKHFYIDSPKF